MLPRIHLVVVQEDAIDRVTRCLSEFDCVLSMAEPEASFWDAIARPADLLLIGRRLLPDPITDAVVAIRQLPDAPEVIVLVDREDAQQRAELLAAGSYAVVSLSIADETFSSTLSALTERCRGELDNRVQLSKSGETASRLSDFASVSPTMHAFMRTVRRVVAADSSLLMLGETGVGKERLARAIHEESPRGDKPFVPVNCAAYPESLLEGELFGYEEGAFTGAISDRRGCFEMAHGGTIFLDEIGEVPRHVQVKLLRVLQERRIQRLGSEDSVAIDVRVMAATNRDLNEEMDAHRFRRDLFYRLSVVSLKIPPLRDHAEDIPGLLDRYLDGFRVTLRKSVRGFSADAIQALCQYRWPGNVRELINVVERATLLCEQDQISLVDLPPEFGGQPLTLTTPQASDEQLESIDLPAQWKTYPWSQLRPAMMTVLERAYLEHHLRAANGRIGQTGKQTGLSTRSLYLMMKRHGLKKESFKPGHS